MLVKLNKKLLPQYSSPRLKVYTVNPTAVSKDHIVFVGGGHNLIYSFIPNGEIWVTEELSPIEVKYFVYHELYEHRKMIMGLDYNTAHKQANTVEGKSRHGTEEELDKLIQTEVERNSNIISERSHFNGTIHLHNNSKIHHAHARKQLESANKISTINAYAK